MGRRKFGRACVFEYEFRVFSTRAHAVVELSCISSVGGRSGGDFNHPITKNSIRQGAWTYDTAFHTGLVQSGRSAPESAIKKCRKVPQKECEEKPTLQKVRYDAVGCIVCLGPAAGPWARASGRAAVRRRPPHRAAPPPPLGRGPQTGKLSRKRLHFPCIIRDGPKRKTMRLWARVLGAYTLLLLPLATGHLNVLISQAEVMKLLGE
ncbi:hypothetical protein EVAR_57402_1 [Eumeta japonica]|uniref:Uncharacterized protein n=1 Tax=Eumeta variegata TaxID=151549 RepID=A0A4C1YGD6_EUMVA|nr:hypothetical protein EVAR_57402_1 [Eumeta japonica]